MKATVKAFVESGLFPRSLELLLAQKDRGYNLDALSNDERIQMERKELAKRFVKTENLHDPSLLNESGRTGSKRLSILNQPGLSLITDHLIDYPAPLNINYFWSFGSLAGICLVVQLASGIFLAMHYTPHVDLAFLSVEHIMRDVEGGWLLRYLHANGASMFFIMVYIHMFRGLYYASYVSPREGVWCVGVVILLLMILNQQH